MADFYLKSGAGAVELTAKAWSAGDKMVPLRADVSANYLVARKWVWECTTPGTSSGTPTWPASVTQDVTTVTEAGGVVWTARKPGYSSGTTANWAFAGIYADYVSSAMAAGDTIYVSNNHAESTATTYYNIGVVSTAALPSKVMCVDDSAAPPTALATTGTITTTGTTDLLISCSNEGAVYCSGLTLNGSTSGNGSTYISATDSVFVLENVTFNHNANGSGGVNLGGAQKRVIAINPTFRITTASQGVQIGGSRIDIIGGKLLGSTSGVFPTALFKLNNGGGVATIDGFDMSGAPSTMHLSTSGYQGNQLVTWRNCKLPPNWSGSLTNGSFAGGTLAMGERLQMFNCTPAGGRPITRIQEGCGTLESDYTVWNTNTEASKDAAHSFKVTTTVYPEFPALYFATQELVAQNNAVTGNVTLTIEIAHPSVGSGTGGLLTNADIWPEAMALSETNSPLGTWVSGRKGILATAVDITESNAVWKGVANNWKFQKLQLTLSPRRKGYIIARVCVAKASITQGIFIDPTIKVV